MGDPGMVLGEQDVRRIGDYVKPWLRDLVSEVVPLRSADISSQLLERMVRVEEELKSQRELFAGRFAAVDERFATMDQRFTDMQTYMDKRFTSMDQRFTDLQTSTDKRFTSMDRRFTDMQTYMDKRFSAMQWTMMIGFTIITAAVTVFGLLA